MATRGSYALRSEIRAAQCASLFARTPIFENADDALLSAICPRLQSEIALPGDWLAREDEVLTYVVFIDTGLVEVLVDDVHVADMGDGSYLGEISALGLGGEAGRGLGLATASVKARDVCSIHVLAKADFVVLMKQCALLTIPPVVPRGMPSSPYLPWCHVSDSRRSSPPSRPSPTSA